MWKERDTDPWQLNMATVDAAAPLVLIPAFLLSLLVFVYVRSVVDWRTRTRGRPLPPGPKPLPLLGNVLNMPKSKAWVVCRDLCVKYGKDSQRWGSVTATHSRGSLLQETYFTSGLSDNLMSSSAAPT